MDTVIQNCDAVDSIIHDENNDLMDTVIGNIDYISEMAGRIPGETKIAGKPKKAGLIIAMGDKEKNIHHFHVFRSEQDKENWCNGACLFLDENKYYDHGKNTSTLSKDELVSVMDKLNQQHPSLGVTNWKYLVTLWNDNNYRYPVDPNLKMPEYDYNKITRYKD